MGGVGIRYVNTFFKKVEAFPTGTHRPLSLSKERLVAGSDLTLPEDHFAHSLHNNFASNILFNTAFGFGWTTQRGQPYKCKCT